MILEFAIPLTYTPCSGPSKTPYLNLNPSLLGCGISNDLDAADSEPVIMVSPVILRVVPSKVIFISA